MWPINSSEHSLREFQLSFFARLSSHGLYYLRGPEAGIIPNPKASIGSLLPQIVLSDGANMEMPSA
jgi:hypothetical protein